MYPAVFRRRVFSSIFMPVPDIRMENCFYKAFRRRCRFRRYSKLEQNRSISDIIYDIHVEHLHYLSGSILLSSIIFISLRI